MKTYFKNNDLISTDIAQQVINRNAEKAFFACDGKFYAVPKDFQCPKNLCLKQAWSCWRQGFPNFRHSENGQIHIVRIRPFRSIKPTMLPKILQFRSVMS